MEKKKKEGITTSMCFILAFLKESSFFSPLRNFLFVFLHDVELQKHLGLMWVSSKCFSWSFSISDSRLRFCLKKQILTCNWI